MSDESNVARGTEYEKFVQLVYQTILNAEGVENVTVQHNILLTGRSGCEHQIDVYWEFRIGGQLYRTAIECKAFNQNVSIGRVRDFYGVLTDVPGLLGAFATLVGYQAGARKYAEHYGISLKELRTPTEADWVGRVKDIHLNLHIVLPSIRGFQLLRTYPLAEGDTGPDYSGELTSTTPIIFDPEEDVALSWSDLLKLLPEAHEAGEGLRHTILLPKHFLRLGAEEIPIEGLELVYDIAVETISRVTRGEDLALALVKDVQTGQMTFVDKKGGARDVTH